MAERKKKTSARKTPALKTPKRKAGAAKNTVTAGVSEVPSEEGPEVKVEGPLSSPTAGNRDRQPGAPASPSHSSATAHEQQHVPSSSDFSARQEA